MDMDSDGRALDADHDLARKIPPMQYRTFPGKEDRLSVLGFGCMRLPILSAKAKDIDKVKAKAMVRKAIDRGVNYIDTAWPYHGGESEKFLADALADGYREQVRLATKLPSWMIKKPEDMDRILDKQLEKLAVSRIDYYLLHALNKEHWKNLNSMGVSCFIDQALQDGRIGQIGFSFHDELALFKEIIDARSWDFCQIQYNFLDIEHQAGRKGLDYAWERGVGIVIMEPLRGGSFTKTVPAAVQEIWNRAPQRRSPAEWGLRWLWNDPRISVVLSGMSDERQVEENILTASQAEPASLTPEELDLVDQVRKVYRERIQVDCTACGYCMPCPHDVAIPDAFRFYNDAFMFDNIPGQRETYRRFNKESGADRCIACGECEPKCPQQIPIISRLEDVRKLFYP